MTQLCQPGRNMCKGVRHVKIVIPASQVDTDANGQVTVTVPELRHISGAKVDAQPAIMGR